MARNKSEKLPHECTEVEPDFYKLLRIYAERHVSREHRSRQVRDGGVFWGISLGRDGSDFWQTFSHLKKDIWFKWSDATKKTYIADYMDYLYGAQ